MPTIPKSSHRLLQRHGDDAGVGAATRVGVGAGAAGAAGAGVGVGAANGGDPAWPPVCSVADLGRLLVMLHGASAPSEAMLKKWSAAGEFRGCLASAESHSEDPGAHARVGPPKPGRPGLRLATERALARVHELWPRLAESDPGAVFELAVARTTHQLAAALAPLVRDHSLAERAAPPSSVPSADDLAKWQQTVDGSLAAIAQDLKELRRELAQFNAMRNNLLTRLDEVVVRSREAAAGREGAGADPLAEARRERDMRSLKSSVDQMALALERIESAQVDRTGR